MTTASLLLKLNDDAAGADEVVKLIEQDAGLAADVLKAANSAYFRRSVEEVTNLRQVLLAMGFNGVKAVVSSVLLEPVVNIKPIYFRMFGQHLWDHSLHCAHACRCLAWGQKADSYSSYLVGLIHDIGKILIFQLLVESIQKFHPEMQPRPHFFVKVIINNPMPLSRMIADSWKFPPDMLTALGEIVRRPPYQEMSSMGRTLFFGNLLAEAHDLLQRKRFSEQIVNEFLKGFGMNLDLIKEIYGGN